MDENESEINCKCTPIKDVLNSSLWECRYAGHALRILLEAAIKVLSASESESTVHCLRIDIFSVLQLLKKANEINENNLLENLEAFMKSPMAERFFNDRKQT